MKIPSNFYVPVLKFKQGEYLALERLKGTVKSSIIPLFIVPPIGFDFEDWKPAKTIDEHLEKIPNRLQAKWGNRRSLFKLELSLHHQTMISGKYAIHHLFDEFRLLALDVIPAFELRDNVNYINRIKAITDQDKKGFALILSLEDLMQTSLDSDLNALNTKFNKNLNNIDLIIDIASSNFENPMAFAKAIKAKLITLPIIQQFRSFIFTGNSFPESFSSISKPGGTIDRNEWMFYKELVKVCQGNCRIPTYGDYCFETPKFQMGLDMRKIKPASRLIYTLSDKWIVHKGGSFRDNPSQQTGHCKSMVSSSYFMGSTFSKGDKHIEECARGIKSHGNLSVWKWVGFNHHMSLVAQDLSIFHAP